MATQAEQSDVAADVREIEAHEKQEVKRDRHPPAKLDDYVYIVMTKKNGLWANFNRKEKAFKYQMEIYINDISGFSSFVRA